MFWLVTDVWACVGWFGYTFCVGLPRGSRVVPVSAASLRASFGWLFPFLLGGTFIEADYQTGEVRQDTRNFPSFWEGLSLRQVDDAVARQQPSVFPFLLGGTFIEAR